MDSLNEVVIPKYDKNNEDIKVSTVQSLPFNSEFSGQVPINSYFITHEEDEEANSDKSLVGYFRGRELKGRDYVLPDDTRGVIISKDDNNFISSDLFLSIRLWEHDVPPDSVENKLNDLLDFTKIANCLHSDS